MKIIAITLICSPLDDAMGSKATVRSKKETIQLIEKMLENAIPESYRCSLVIATNE